MDENQAAAVETKQEEEQVIKLVKVISQSVNSRKAQITGRLNKGPVRTFHVRYLSGSGWYGKGHGGSRVKVVGM